MITSDVFPGEIFAVGFICKIAGFLRRRPLVAPGKATIVASACGKLPFILSRQTVVTSGGALGRQRVQPCDKSLRVIVSDADGGLVIAIKDVLREAVRAGGSSLRDHRRANGELGYFQKRFAVYDREGQPCIRSRCRGTIKRITQSGRSTFYCPVCQAS